MRLSQRLLLYALLVVSVLVAFTLVAVRERTVDGLRASTLERVRAEAALAAAAWRPGTPAPALADSLARTLDRHVTLLDPGGAVVGDSESDDLSAGWLRNYAALPEVEGARRTRGSHAARSSAAGATELAGAASGAAGAVRVAAPLETGAAIVADVRRGVRLTALAALALSAGVALLSARTVTRPPGELRDVTRALAGGDLSRRPALAAPGEVGELATAVHRLAEQLGARLDALQAEEDLMAAVGEALSEAVVAVDARQRVVRANASARQLLRLRDPIPFPADHLPRDRTLREALGDALRGEASGPAELRLDGRTLTLTARPLPGGAGAVLAFYDLTPVRRLEHVRRDFVANVSHELKTPLTVVGGFAETLADDELPPAMRRQFAETIRDNAQRMQRIVDDLLDLSRIESGVWQPMRTDVDVGAAAADATAAARVVASAKGVAVAVQPAADAPAVHADPSAVRQVLSNLVENAVRHTAAGTVTVFTARDDGGVWLGVRDTGAGIGADHLPRIFERFYRADPGRARDVGGTGLGLSIVKHLVEAHGGEVRAESRPGAGTTIMARFPGPS
ncbi:HAMP domain-containing sensor histidine kinase [Roseisolibacter sp. H3M3-2]|uniref:sensor histidine kinase n=1 Tax=Roseisolibacter sp. H3M3-2 TaxID=3031323 RepID=UPI0023DC537C|nr:HAMP domain-containing sensor histidine kinase [Roseisolibacter sp. H3M3-2]MDF1501910.1 ATP-binding protein [Roseisolibacter sp. H3M3-2]